MMQVVEAPRAGRQRLLEQHDAVDGLSAKELQVKETIENTVLRFLGSHTFSHGLGREVPSAPGTKCRPSAIGSLFPIAILRGEHAQLAARPSTHIVTVNLSR